MTQDKKINILCDLSLFKVKIYNICNESCLISGFDHKLYNIIDRNLTSIEKQIKKL